MLRKRDVEFVRDYYERDDIQLSEAAIRGRLYRLREKIEETMKMLTELAKALPEQQKQQVFTSEKLSDFIDALLSYEADNRSKLVKNERAFKLACMLADKAKKGADLIKSPYASMLISEEPPTYQLRAMLFIERFME